ncbi:hypothetical protein A2U01_0098739, partial [Trifolium medium]|nr:hypothetical protein [Trifolium medium]
MSANITTVAATHVKEDDALR